MPINNVDSNAPENMQPYIRELEAKINAMTIALATLGVTI